MKFLIPLFHAFTFALSQCLLSLNRIFMEDRRRFDNATFLLSFIVTNHIVISLYGVGFKTF